MNRLLVQLLLSMLALPVSAQSFLHSAFGEDVGTARNSTKALEFHLDLAERAVELYWEMPLEANITGYEIQRAINGNEFKSIAWVGAVGDAQVGGTYLHLDQQLFTNERLSYRLKITYDDGQQDYSDIHILDLQLIRSYVEFSPTTSILPKAIAFNNKDVDTSRAIQLLDTKGKVLQTYKFGVFKTAINLSSYENGVYFVHIPTLNGTQRIERLVKQ
ncbi:MAG: T9SS type A sorting domain-containing protein [Saprospiraceae bacterium]|nr:T9SS type A sorting domain-containing protein [Saprospiraceae bacterium]